MFLDVDFYWGGRETVFESDYGDRFEALELVGQRGVPQDDVRVSLEVSLAGGRDKLPVDVFQRLNQSLMGKRIYEVRFANVQFGPQYTVPLKDLSCEELIVTGGNMPHNALLGLVPLLLNVQRMTLRGCCDLSDERTLEVICVILEHSTHLEQLTLVSPTGSRANLEQLAQAYLKRRWSGGKSLRNLEIISDEAGAGAEYFLAALNRRAEKDLYEAIPLPSALAKQIAEISGFVD